MFHLSFHRLALVIGLVWVVATPMVLAQPPATVRLEPSTIQAVPGQSIEVRVWIDNVRNLGAFQFNLLHNPEVLQIDSVTIGDFPASTGRNVNPLGPKIDPEAGRALFGAFSFGDPPGPDGSGVLAIVTLVVKGPGQSELTLDDVEVVDTSGAQIAVKVEGDTMIVSEGPAAQPQRTAPPTATVVVTPTVSIPLTATPMLAERLGDAPDSTLREWVIVLLALAGVVGLVVVLARQLARSV